MTETEKLFKKIMADHDIKNYAALAVITGKNRARISQYVNEVEPIPGSFVMKLIEAFDLKKSQVKGIAKLLQSQGRISFDLSKMGKEKIVSLLEKLGE